MVFARGCGPFCSNLGVHVFCKIAGVTCFPRVILGVVDVIPGKIKKPKNYTPFIFCVGEILIPTKLSKPAKGPFTNIVEGTFHKVEGVDTLT